MSDSPLARRDASYSADVASQADQGRHARSHRVGLTFEHRPKNGVPSSQWEIPHGARHGPTRPRCLDPHLALEESLDFRDIVRLMGKADVCEPHATVSFAAEPLEAEDRAVLDRARRHEP
jgi:hypothetical protein